MLKLCLHLRRGKPLHNRRYETMVLGLGRSRAMRHIRIPQNNGAMHTWYAAPSDVPHSYIVKCANALFRSL